MNYRVDSRGRVGLTVRRANGVLLFVALLVMSVLPLAFASDAPANIRIAAASSLQFALNEVIDNYRRSLNDSSAAANIQIVYGSSGNLYRQIVQGAPFDLFLSADASLVDKLHEQGVAPNRGVEFGHGRLVLGMSKGLTQGFSHKAAESALRTLAESAGNSRLAIANPVHAPYGKAARQLLESLDLWARLKPRLVYGEKVSQATQFVTSGAIDMAIISLSLALAVEIDYLSVDTGYYQPIDHKMILLTEGRKSINDLYSYLTTDGSVVSVFEKYGYVRETE